MQNSLVLIWTKLKRVCSNFSPTPANVFFRCRTLYRNTQHRQLTVHVQATCTKFLRNNIPTYIHNMHTCIHNIPVSVFIANVLKEMSLDLKKFHFISMFCLLNSLIIWIYLYRFKYLINYELCKTNVWIWKYGECWISENFFLVACIIHVFFLYSDYICSSLNVSRIFAEPQICYLIFDIFSIYFQYSLACKLNNISVFILNFFII